jgi:hypothetical protein
MISAASTVSEVNAAMTEVYISNVTSVISIEKLNVSTNAASIDTKSTMAAPESVTILKVARMNLRTVMSTLIIVMMSLISLSSCTRKSSNFIVTKSKLMSETMIFGKMLKSTISCSLKNAMMVVWKALNSKTST